MEHVLWVAKIVVFILSAFLSSWCLKLLLSAIAGVTTTFKRALLYYGVMLLVTVVIWAAAQLILFGKLVAGGVDYGFYLTVIVLFFIGVQLLRRLFRQGDASMMVAQRALGIVVAFVFLSGALGRLVEVFIWPLEIIAGK